MKRQLKQMIIGTRAEPFARRLHRSLIAAVATAPPSVEARNHQYDVQSARVMQRVLRADSNCVDVGCHKGLILQKLLELAPAGRHFAFEPIPALHRALLENFGQKDNVRIFDCALSDAAGRSTYQHVLSNSAYSGLRRRSYRKQEEIQEIEVPVETLDHVIPADVPIHFIKIDVEGGEGGVLRGAIETVRRSRPTVVFEHGLGGADFYGTRPDDVYRILADECGLAVFLMADWLERGGKAALSRSAFCDQFDEGKNYYFMAAA